MKKFLLLTFSEHILFPKSKVRDSEILCNLPFGMAYLQLTAGSKPYTSDIWYQSSELFANKKQ
jgi:hypothetical protein